MRNPRIQQMIADRLDAMVEPSLRALAEGLQATKRRAFVIQAGEIRYTDPEPDHLVRTATANKVLDRYERSSSGYAAGSGADVVPVHETGAELPEEMADEIKAEGCGDRGIDGVAELDPADRALFQQAAEIDAKLAELDEPDDGHGEDGGHGPDQ